MVPSKAPGFVRELVVRGTLPPLPAGLAAEAVLAAAREQGTSSLLLAALERERPAWAEAILAPLAAGRRALLVRTLGQIGLAARGLALLEARGIRALPLKGAVLAETVCGVEADRPMSDVDLLALERFAEAAEALALAGFTEVARGDHAWAYRDPEGHGILELHRSVVSAPGLYPLDREGLWARRREGRGQLRVLPSAEDLLLQLALHAAFQHGLVLSLAQWLDFRLVLERERIDVGQLVALATAARARAPLAAALVVAQAVTGVRAPSELVRGLPRSMARRLEPLLEAPLGFVAPAEPALARVRFELAAGRRLELVWRTLVLPETPEGDERLAARVRFAFGRALRLARREAVSPATEAPSLAEVHDLGEPQAGVGDGVEVPFGEELLRDCLAEFPHVRLTVTGRCMEPALAHGEKVHLVSATRRRPRVGDVVLSRQKEGLRLHRLVFGPPLAPR
ncbi:MAG TPA: nucleotidyltransferase family protein, partial [Vicinamibacteria bacterium]|nr:nucleotidyltransferase family protein [Vicinamibacteria bacterium]